MAFRKAAPGCRALASAPWGDVRAISCLFMNLSEVPSLERACDVTTSAGTALRSDDLEEETRCGDPKGASPRLSTLGLHDAKPLGLSDAEEDVCVPRHFSTTTSFTLTVPKAKPMLRLVFGRAMEACS